MAHWVELDDAFRGPLDLLLHLVRREEIDLHDIPIARLTRAYLDEIGKMEFVDVDQAGEFLSLASMLVEIKSRTLLPPAETEDGPDGAEEEFDPRAGLVQALLEYQRYREAAENLEERARRQADRFPRVGGVGALAEVETPDGGDPGDEGRFDVGGLLLAFQKMLDKMRVAQAAEIVNPHVPTERRMAQIETAVAAGRTVRLSELLSERPSRDEMVGFFIAVLELVRQHKVRARQSVDFSDILLIPRTDAPRAAKGDGDRLRRKRLWWRARRRPPVPSWMAAAPVGRFLADWAGRTTVFVRALALAVRRSGLDGGAAPAWSGRAALPAATRGGVPVFPLREAFGDFSAFEAPPRVPVVFPATAPARRSWKGKFRLIPSGNSADTPEAPGKVSPGVSANPPPPPSPPVAPELPAAAVVDPVSPTTTPVAGSRAAVEIAAVVGTTPSFRAVGRGAARPSGFFLAVGGRAAGTKASVAGPAVAGGNRFPPVGPGGRSPFSTKAAGVAALRRVPAAFPPGGARGKAPARVAGTSGKETFRCRCRWN